MEKNLYLYLREMGTHIPAVPGAPPEVHAGFIELFWLQGTTRSFSEQGGFLCSEELEWTGKKETKWGHFVQPT